MEFKKDYISTNGISGPTRRITRVFFDTSYPAEAHHFRLLEVYLPCAPTFPPLFLKIAEVGVIDLYDERTEKDIDNLVQEAIGYIPLHTSLIDINQDLEYLRPQTIQLPDETETVTAA